MADADDIACGLGLADAWGDASFVPHARTFTFTAVGRQLRTTAGAAVSTVNATPDVLDLGAGESIALSFDFTDDVADSTNDQIASVAVTLVDQVSGASYPTGLSGAASSIALVATQQITGLVAGRKYLLTVAATMTLSAQTYEMGLLITCPY